MHPSIRNRDVMNNKLETAATALTSSDDSTVTTDLMEAVTSESSSSSSNSSSSSSGASWLPGLILAVVSSLILILFLVTLLVSRLPRLQKWLSPVLIRIAPPAANGDYNGKQPPSSSSADLMANGHHGVLRHHQGGRQGEDDLASSGGYQHSNSQYQSGSRNRPSRPSSLPCLPEEKLAYYQHPSYSSTASTTVGSVLASAATAAVNTAQAAAISHRPHSFYPPAQQLLDDDGEEEEEDEDVLLSVVGSSAGSAQPPVAGTAGHHQSRGRHLHQQRKLNLTLHSDGSEASNSSSSASGAGAVDHRSSGPSISTNEAMNLRQRSANQYHHHRDVSPNKNQHPTRPASEAGSVSSRQSAAEHHHPFRRHQLIDRQEDATRRLQHDDWTAAGKTSRLHHPPIQRQSSLVETDCDQRCHSAGRKDEHHLHLESTGNNDQQLQPQANKIPDVVVVDTDHQQGADEQAALSSSSDESLPLSDETPSLSSSARSKSNLKGSRSLSRSLAALTGGRFDRFRTMISKRRPGGPKHSESMMDMTDMSSTFGESESVLGGSVLNMPGSLMAIGGSKAILELGMTYSPAAGKMAVRLIELRQLNAATAAGGGPVNIGRMSNSGTSFQLRLLLLPERKQRHKTKLRYVSESGTTAPIGETFIFNRIEPGELSSMGIRFRLYCSERLRRERLLGESFASLKLLALDQLHREQQLIIQFEAPTGPFKKSLSALGRSTSSSSSRGDVSPTSMTGVGSFSAENWNQPEMIPPRHHGIPEVLLGLAYNGTTGLLSVEVLRAAALRSWTSSRLPDVCVKVLVLTHTGQEIGRAKTTVKKSSDAPTWLESFSFQVTLFQLTDVTLLVSVINKRSLKRKELLGWVSLSSDGDDNSAAVDQQTADHWHEMREAAGEQVCHWHALLSP